MKTLLISGYPDTGKTGLLQRLVNNTRLGVFVIDSTVMPIPIFSPTIRPTVDFIALIEIDGVRVIINTESDVPNSITKLRSFFNKHNSIKPIDILITSIRNAGDPVRDLLLREFGLIITPPNIPSPDIVEIPLGRVVVRNAVRRAIAVHGMQEAVDKLVIHTLSNNPFGLRL
ncbi:MAG: hypothetical protein LBU91_00135 [Bacteroidales bacterium]|jgi:hypothetical protein|nr:hypothetical protein [Bacteroidales bacterium]